MTVRRGRLNGGVRTQNIPFFSETRRISMGDTLWYAVSCMAGPTNERTGDVDLHHYFEVNRITRRFHSSFGYASITQGAPKRVHTKSRSLVYRSVIAGQREQRRDIEQGGQFAGFASRLSKPSHPALRPSFFSNLGGRRGPLSHPLAAESRRRKWQGMDCVHFPSQEQSAPLVVVWRKEILHLWGRESDPR